MAPAHAVRLDDALGRAGRSGRIDDVEGLFGIEVDGRRPRAGGREPSIERRVCRAFKRDALRGWRVRNAVDSGGRSVVKEQERRAAIAHHGGELFGGRRRSERAGGRADAKSRNISDDILHRRRAAHRDRAAIANPVTLHRRRRAIHQPVKRGKRDLAFAIDDRDVIRPLRSVSTDDVRHRREVALQEFGCGCHAYGSVQLSGL